MSDRRNVGDDSGITSAKKGGLWRWVIAIVVIAAVAIALRFLPLREYMGRVLAWAEGLGAWGPIAAGAAYIPACVFFLPGSILTMGIGAVFGLLRGVIAVSIGSTIGATVAFILGRTIARDFVEKRVASSPKFSAVDSAVEREGFKIVLLTRLSPVFPFNLLNYAYGLTRVRLRDYFLASWIGMLPGTIMFVYIGAAIGSVTQIVAGAERTRTPLEWTMYGVGLVATVIVTIYVTRIARRALKQAVPEVEKNETQTKESEAGEGETDD